MYLQTERMTLRRLTNDDDVNLLTLDSDPDVMRFLGPPETDIEAHRQWLRERAIPYYDAHPGYGFFAAEETATGAFMGWFILRPALHYRFAREVEFQEGEVEIGYRLLPQFWNRGYATEGTKALIQKAFGALGVKTAVAVALVTNIGSWRVMEKSGMERRGEFPLPGKDAPAVTYRICRCDEETV